MNELIQLNGRRAQQARLARRIGRPAYAALVGAAAVFAIVGLALGIVTSWRWTLVLASPALLCLLPAIWYKQGLSVLPPTGNDITGRLHGDVLARLRPGASQDPRSVWTALAGHWQAIFFMNHLLLPAALIAESLSADPADLAAALQLAAQLADQNQSPMIEVGFVVAGLLAGSPAIQKSLVERKLQPADITAVADWLGRNVVESKLPQHLGGGIGRDWAFGFTPLLDRLGHNVSLSIVDHGAHFGWLTGSEGVKAIEAAFENNANAVALIGPDGIGKTSTVYALAQRLFSGQAGPALAYHQIVALNATDITSNAEGPRDLEQLMIAISNEAIKAGHIMLFFDDAQLFFTDAAGAVDATQILLSLIQGRGAPMILAMSPEDYQRLRAHNQSLAGLLTPVVLKELPEPDVLRVLEDTATGLEGRSGVLVAYEALREAYQLSGRYEPDGAYPGKAIKLLQEALSHADNGMVTAESVQQAVEQAHGVKVGTAAPAEADTLLHLEEQIHRRMINQTHAVGVVAGALRRARAGVSNPKRPIGSFLFLGPTGVGKTELAKAVAATYFKSEANMIRLDMSEYQQPSDVDRLLSNGAEDSGSLIMAVREQPFSVVLLDEVEKAHPNVLNLLLQLLDEGNLTDTAGKAVSFKDCIIIATSNAGANTIRERVGKGETLESFQPQFVDELINSGQFKPELLNRFDEMVLFRPLNPDELAQVVSLMLVEINQTLAKQNISVELTQAAIQKVVTEGNDPRLGARPMRRTLQKAVEDVVAKHILDQTAQAGDHIILDAPDLAL
jgi:ATP-dependent Clp protease ATP-binding subunit ClpC